jgi:hypothetical protein
MLLLVALQNDDYGTRQFLYPQIPEPSTLALAALGLLGLGVAGRRRRR